MNKVYPVHRLYAASFHKVSQRRLANTLRDAYTILKRWVVQVMDPKLASYGVENAVAAVVQLAQTTMRSELGKITLDKTFEERTALNLNIVKSIQ